MPAFRSHGKNGALWLQVGSTAVAGPTSCTGNAAIETVDGVAYDPYQVWTLSTAGNIPMDPGTIPTVAAPGGTGLPTAYTYEWNALRGKFIYTPTLGSGATLTNAISAYAIPKLYQQGDMVDFSVDADQDMADRTAMGDGWKRNLVGFRSWKGAATIFWKGSAFWSSGPGGNIETPYVMRFYPNRTVPTEYILGAGFLTWGIKVTKGDTIQQSVAITGDGPLISVGF